PWKTIGRALASDGARSGDTILVAAGTYSEALQTTQPGVTFRAVGTVVIAPPSGGSAIHVEHASVLVAGFTFQGGLHGLRAAHAQAVIARRGKASGQRGNGIVVGGSTGALVDSNEVQSATGQGIIVKRSGGASVRNNLVVGSGEGGIHIDNGDTPLPPTTSG